MASHTPEEELLGVEEAAFLSGGSNAEEDRKHATARRLLMCFLQSLGVLLSKASRCGIPALLGDHAWLQVRSETTRRPPILSISMLVMLSCVWALVGEAH